MSIITKKVTMTETAWSFVRHLLEDDEHYELPRSNQGIIDCSDAITALAEAEIVAVSETYALPDAWAKDAENEGA